MAAVKSGKVRIDGRVVKPAHTLSVGDSLQVRRGAFVYDITVEALSAKRGNAPAAQLLYVESEDSKRGRALLRENLKMSRQLAIPPQTKPDKKARRQIRSLRYKAQ